MRLLVALTLLVILCWPAMADRKAIVRGGLVENVAEIAADATWSPPPGTVAISDPSGKASPGGSWDGTKFIPPAAPVKPVLTTEEKLLKVGLTVEELKAALAK